jgi:hypothetical protein
MILDWIFAGLLLAIFIVVLIVGVAIIFAAYSIPKSLLNDNTINGIYNNLLISGSLAIADGSVGIIVTIMAFLFLFISIFTSFLKTIPLIAKVIIKLVYGTVASIILLYVAISMTIEAENIKNSRQYHLAHFSLKKELDAVINTILAVSYVFYGLFAGLVIIFLLMIIYDCLAKRSPAQPKNVNMEVVDSTDQYYQEQN